MSIKPSTITITKSHRIVSTLRRIISATISISIALLIMSCSSDKIEFVTFDSPSWKASAKDCDGYRASVIIVMHTEFDKLHGLNENEIIELLGKPKETHLYTRGQKFIIYPIECRGENKSTDNLRLRFSALGFVNEVLVVK